MTMTSPFLPTTTTRTSAGVTHIDLNFASEMTKGSGSIFVTDGAIQTVIDRVTGQPKMRVVGATFTKEISLDQVHISGTHVMFEAAGLAPGLAYNVYMGAGTLLSGGRAYAGFSAPGQSSFTTPEVVVTPPGALTATIELDGSSLKSGEDIAVTITFSKPVAELNATSFAAGGASIEYLSSFGDGKTWVATLKGLPATDAPASVLRLDMASVVALDGSRGAGVLQSDAYLVDTIVAAYVGEQIDLDDDAGPYGDDGVSNDNTMSVSGLLHGTLASGEVFELIVNGRTIDPSKIAFTWQFGVQKWTYTNDAEQFNPGENNVQARIVGGSHSSLTATKQILIETDTPDIVASPTAPVDLSKAITISFDENIYWDDNVEVTQDIRVVDSFGNTSWIDLEQSHISTDGKSLVFQPADHRLATGNSYKLYLPSDLTDLAGNHYAGPAVEFTTAGPYQDKAPPRLVQAYIVNGNGSYGKGDVLEFRLRFSEKVTLDAGTSVRLDLSNDKIATYTGMSSDGKEMIFNYTVGDGGDIESLDLYTPWGLQGKVRDDAGNIMQHAHIEFHNDGLTTADGYGAMVEIDTVARMLERPQLHAESDTGTAGDRITTDTTPRLTGTGAEAFAAIKLYDGDVLVGSATADADGKWDATLSSPLALRTHTIRATQQDDAGNTSELSAGLDITVIGLSPLSVALDAGSDTGVSAGDRLTSDNRPTLTGYAAANTTLKLSHNGADIGLVTTDENGNWSHRTDELANGAHSFSLRYSDTAGHDAPTPATVTITVDTTKPSVATSPDGETSFAVGRAIAITFSEAVQWSAVDGDGDMLSLRDKDGNVHKVQVDASHFSNDKRTLTIPAGEHGLKPLTDYGITLPSTLRDAAGNAMGEYQIYFRTGDSSLPSAVKAIVSGDGHYREGDGITFRILFNEAIQRVGTADMWLGLSNGARAGLLGIDGNEAHFAYAVGTGKDHADVKITDTSTLAGNLADLSGNLLDSAHIVFSGLHNEQGYGAHIEIDTVAPATLAAPQLHVISNSGIDDDRLTNERAPILTGSGAEAWADIELYVGDVRVGTGYADDKGDWSATVSSSKALADGEHQLVVVQLDEAGNRSAVSAPLALTIDATVASLAAPRLAEGDDTGKSGSDKLTNKDDIRLSGSGAEAGADIRIFSGDTVIGFGSADANGHWTAELFTELGSGDYSFTAQQKDAAGNLSAVSEALVFTVDRVAPDKPGTPVLAAASDSGVKGDGSTSNKTPTFSGSAAEQNAEVVLYDGAVEIGRSFADGSGNWTVSVAAAKALADGLHSIQLKQIDAAGNTSAFSDPFGLRIDSAAAAPGRPVLASTSDSGASNSDGITNDTTPSFSGGGAEASASVVLYAGTREIGRTTANSDGNWSLEVGMADKFTADGAYAITAVQTDRAGNTSAASSAFALVIDTAGPTVSSFSTSRSAKEFQLAFSETIQFHPSGQFDLKENSLARDNFKGNSNGNWYTSSGAGGVDSALNFKIALTGLFNLHMNNDAVQDLAGNVAVIGSPQWLVDLGGITS